MMSDDGVNMHSTVKTIYPLAAWALESTREELWFVLLIHSSDCMPLMQQNILKETKTYLLQILNDNNWTK